ncbi:MAG: LysR family transcriptional regulator [Bdellovibrionaceae bacterium]|nr:LysR family transcriptional regulator [Pseudobdellovibrionaceae bacterium]
MKKLKDINWNQVYYFYEVARKMSMKEAAEVTGVSIPTVSEQIKRLETLLETPLFHRRPRRIELTLEGETLYQHAKQMFESGLRFLDVVSPTVIGGYPVRIGIQESFAAALALDFLMKYFDVYSPFGTVHTAREPIADRLIENIYTGVFDWGLTLTAPNSTRLEYGKIGSAEIVFVASHELLEKHKNRVEIFQEVPLARGRWDEHLNKLISDHLQAADIYVEEVIDSDHVEFCLRLAEQGKCVTAVSRNFAPDGSQGRLRTFGIGGPIVLPYYAVWRQSSQRMIAIRKLIDLLERDSKMIRSRQGPGQPTGVGGAGMEPPPIELPHHFEAESWSDFERE